MKLRDSPLVTRKNGIKTWPPPWSSTRRDEKDWPTGEDVTLQQAWLHDGSDICIFLFIEHNGHQYIGSLYFDDLASCYEVDGLLKSNLGRSIKEIGDLEVLRLL